MSNRQADPDFLLTAEYNGASKLNTRIEIQEHFSTNTAGWFLWLYDQFRLPSSCLILELGSGPANLWLENCGRIPGGWSVVLSDLSIGMLEKARQTLPWPQFTLATLNAETIPFATGQFDAVIANGLFDHLPHPQQAFAEIERVLKPGGYLYSATGGQAHLRELEAMVKPFVPDADYGGASERFGLENGAALLSAWFTDVRSYPYDDRLVFHEAGPIVAYVLSEAEVSRKMVGELRAAFIRSVEKQLTAEGSLQVTMNKGLFTARKP